MLVVRNSEIVQRGFVGVLRGEAGVEEVAVDVVPFAQSAIIEHLEFVGDDKRHDVVGQAFFEQEEATDATVTILERMNALETHMEIEQVVERFGGLGVILGQEACHGVVNIFGCTGFGAAYFVGQLLVFAYGKPWLTTVGSGGFERGVELFDVGFGEGLFGRVDDEVDATEVVHRFDDVVDIDGIVGNADSVGLEDVARLLVT